MIIDILYFYYKKISTSMKSNYILFTCIGIICIMISQILSLYIQRNFFVTKKYNILYCYEYIDDVNYAIDLFNISLTKFNKKDCNNLSTCDNINNKIRPYFTSFINEPDTLSTHRENKYIKILNHIFDNTNICATIIYTRISIIFMTILIIILSFVIHIIHNINKYYDFVESQQFTSISNILIKSTSIIVRNFIYYSFIIIIKVITLLYKLIVKWFSSKKD